MTEIDKTAATGLILRINGYLLALTLLLVFAFAVLAGWLYGRLTNASFSAVIVLAAAGLILAAGALVTIRELVRLSGFGYCGFWNHRGAARLLYCQSLALIVVSLAATVAILMA
jgi:hypothetical protein